MRKLLSTQYGITLDGADDGVNGPSGYTLPTSGFTVMFQYVPLVHETNDRIFDNQDSGPANGATLVAVANSPQVSFVVRNDVNTQASINSTNLRYGVKSWIACTYETNSAKLYVDNVQQGSTDTSVAMTVAAAIVCFGHRAAGANWVKGELYGPVLIYSRVLNTTEMANIIAGGEPSTTNLDIYWKLDELSGAVATDYSGNGRNGTVVGTPRYLVDSNRRNPVTGSESSLYFGNAASNRVVVTDNAALRPEADSAFSLSAFVQLDNLKNNVLPRFWEKAPHFWCFMGDVTNTQYGRVALEIANDDDSTIEYWSTPRLAMNRWYHLGLTFDNGTCKMYVNGVQVPVFTLLGPYSETQATAGNNVIIGNSIANNRNLSGEMYGFRYFNVALTNNEMLSLANGGDITRGLQLSLPMTEGTGATVSDESGNGLNGTITGATWRTNINVRTENGSRTEAGTRTAA